MSDTQAGAAPEVAPAEATPEAVTPEVTPESVEQAQELELVRGKGRPGALQNVRKRAERFAKEAAARNTAEAARERALGQPRKPAGTSEGGEFAKGEGSEPAPSPEVAAEQVAATTKPAAETVAGEGSEGITKSAGTAKAPDGWVDIPLPEGHPLRDQGKTHIRALKEQERDIRSGINAAIKLREAESERERLLRQNALLEARQAALSGDQPNPDSDPSVQELLRQIREAPGFGDGLAERVLQGLKADAELRVIKAERQAETDFSIERTAAQVAGDIESKAAEMFRIWSQAGEVQRHLHGPRGLIAQYYAAVDDRNQRDGTNLQPSTGEFFRWAQQAYAADPRVRAEIERIQKADKTRTEEEIRAKVRAEFEEEQRKKAAEAAQRHSKLPPTSRPLPSTSTPVTTATESREPIVPGTNPRQAAKQRIRERFAGL